MPPTRRRRRPRCRGRAIRCQQKPFQRWAWRQARLGSAHGAVPSAHAAAFQAPRAHGWPLTLHPHPHHRRRLWPSPSPWLLDRWCCEHEPRATAERERVLAAERRMPIGAVPMTKSAVQGKLMQYLIKLYEGKRQRSGSSSGDLSARFTKLFHPADILQCEVCIFM